MASNHHLQLSAGQNDMINLLIKFRIQHTNGNHYWYNVGYVVTNNAGTENWYFKQSMFEDLDGITGIKIRRVSQPLDSSGCPIPYELPGAEHVATFQNPTASSPPMEWSSSGPPSSSNSNTVLSNKYSGCDPMNRPFSMQFRWQKSPGKPLEAWIQYKEEKVELFKPGPEGMEATVTLGPADPEVGSWMEMLNQSPS